MIVERSTHPAWLSNAYLVAAGEGEPAVAVDSGAPLDPLFEAVSRMDLKVRAILTTHRHPDHVGGHGAWVRRTGAAVFALRGEAQHVPGARALDPDQELRFGESLRVRAIPLPGHTSGHAGYLVEGVGLFTGDCLFAGSLGGTAGPAATGFEDVRRSVERILTLPDATPIHPGHAGPTTVGRERNENPFLRVLTGAEREGNGRGAAMGRRCRIVVLARDYDGGTKAWIRFLDDGTDAVVPGSRIEVETPP